MKRLLDTSVLVPAFVSRHPRHERAAEALRQALEGELLVAAHSLLETWAVLTRLPSSPRISGAMAGRLIRENLKTSRTVTLNARDHDSILARAADLGLAGGAIYDAIVVQAAIKSAADQLLTLNGSDFRRVWPEAGERLQVLA